MVCRWWVHPLFTLLSAASLFSLWAVGASLFSLGWVLASFSLAECALGVYGVYGGVCRWCATGYRYVYRSIIVTYIVIYIVIYIVLLSFLFPPLLSPLLSISMTIKNGR